MTTNISRLVESTDSILILCTKSHRPPAERVAWMRCGWYRVQSTRFENTQMPGIIFAGFIIKIRTGKEERDAVYHCLRIKGKNLRP